MGFKLAEFFVDLKVQGDSLTLKSMANSMSEMKLETLGEIGALGALGLALKNVGQEAMNLSTGYTAINKEYGTNINLLQRWQNVARASNVPVEAVSQTFTQMQKLLASPFIGNPNSGFMKAAGLLGIQGANRMNAEQLNEVLRVAVPRYVQRMTPTQGRENALTNAGSLIEALGATRNMMQMYMLPEAQFRKKEGNAPIMSAEDIRRWTELSEQIQVVSHRLFMVGEEILQHALPELLKWTQAIIDSEKIISNVFGARFQRADETASQPYYVPGGGSDVVHALASFIAPNFTKAHSAPVPTIQQTNDTDIHVYGEPGGQLPEAILRAQERVHQHQMTRAAQMLNAQQAY